MSVRRVEYKGMLIKAAVFEVMGTGRFIPSLLIRRAGSTNRSNAKLFHLPWASACFEDPDEALDCTVVYARAIIDGEVPGYTIADL